jgi:hypothetical protein
VMLPVRISGNGSDAAGSVHQDLVKPGFQCGSLAEVVAPL